MTQTQWRRRVFKPFVWLACLTPAALLLYNGFQGELGANPVETITNTTGIWTLRLVVIGLAITPLRWASGLNQLITYRRAVGLFAFFYGTLHFLTYFILDHQLEFGGLWDDVVKRPYITAGFTAFVLMIPLAVTSTKGWIRRLGRRWQVLHRLIYISAVCAAIHYLWKVKVMIGSPVYYAIAIGLLLAFRVAWQLRSAKALKAQRVTA